MVTYSIDKTNANIGETITLSRSENEDTVTVTFWFIDLQPSDYGFPLGNPFSSTKCLANIGKLFATQISLSETVTIEDNHTIAHTLTPITLSAPTTQYINSVYTTPIYELQGNSNIAMDIGEPIEVNFNRNIYNQLKFLVNRWTKGKEDNSNKVTIISSSSTDTQYPSAKLLYNQLAEKLDKEEDNLITVTDSNIFNSSDYHTKDRWSSEGRTGGSVTSTTLTSGSQGYGWYVYNFPSNVTSITMHLLCDTDDAYVSDDEGRDVIEIASNQNGTTYTATSDDGLGIQIGSANKTVTYTITSITFNMNNWIDKIYPIGAIYISIVDVAPSTLFGGRWEQIKDKFLLSAGDTYANGSTGGSATVTLTANQSGLKAHGHGMAHTHNHRHDLNKNFSTGTGSVSAYTVTSNRSTSTQYTGYDNTASSKSTTDNNTSSNASESHENMPPYLAVYMWKRIA